VDGALVVLVLIAAGLLIGMVEQLRERRRLLAALLAVGVRRRTLGGALLVQTAVPVLLGLALAVARASSRRAAAADRGRAGRAGRMDDRLADGRGRPPRSSSRRAACR
jgi:hypothetical protein